MRLFVDDCWLDHPVLDKERKMTEFVNVVMMFRAAKIVIIEIGSGMLDPRVKVGFTESPLSQSDGGHCIMFLGPTDGRGTV